MIYAHRSLPIDAGAARRFSMRTLLKQLLAAVVALSMAGCTTIQPLSVNASELARTLKRGDQVEVTTSRGQQLNFKVDSVDDTGVQGAGQRVAFNDIESISRKQTDTKRTTLVVSASSRLERWPRRPEAAAVVAAAVTEACVRCGSGWSSCRCRPGCSSGRRRGRSRS